MHLSFADLKTLANLPDEKTMTPAEILEEDVTKKAEDWKFWYLLNKFLSNSMFLIVIGGGLVSSASAFASDQIKTFIDPKAFGGFAGAAVVAAKLAEDNFKFGKKSEEYGESHEKIEALVSAIKTVRLSKDPDTELIELRTKYLSLCNENANRGGSNTKPKVSVD
jgi:hypothetical protein